MTIYFYDPMRVVYISNKYINNNLYTSYWYGAEIAVCSDIYDCVIKLDNTFTLV